MKNKILVIFFIGCLTACMPATPSPEIIQTAIAETNAAAPTKYINGHKHRNTYANCDLETFLYSNDSKRGICN